MELKHSLGEIVFTPAALVGILALVGTAKKMNVEVSAGMFCSPCTETPWLLPENPISKVFNMPDKHNNIAVLSMVFPKQVGSLATNEFEDDDMMNEIIAINKEAYPWASRAYYCGWMHTHPNNYGVTPSNTDLTNFEKHRTDRQLFFMPIISPEKIFTRNPDFKTGMSMSLYVSTQQYIPAGITQKGDAWNGNVAIGKHPIIKGVTYKMDDMIIKGLNIEILNWMYPSIVKDLFSSSPTKEGYYIPAHEGHGDIFVPSMETIASRVSRFSYGATAKTTTAKTAAEPGFKPSSYDTKQPKKYTDDIDFSSLELH